MQANGVFAFGVYVGGGLSSLSIAMAKSVGWRASAYIVASYGFCLALLTRLTVREPQRRIALQRESVRHEPADDEEDGYGFWGR